MNERPFIFDREGIRALDRCAIEEYGIPGIALMENAARGAAGVALEMHDAADGSKNGETRTLIVCGPGNNGGDGYAMARHLHNAGLDLTLIALGEPRPGTDAATNRETCRRMNLPHLTMEEVGDASRFDLIIDAIFGTGLDRVVTDSPAEAIEWINRAGRPVLAVDVPSGLDAETGRPLGQVIRATRTATFVGLKRGFLEPQAGQFTGEVSVIDIGAPVELARRFAIRNRRCDAESAAGGRG